MTGRGLHGFLGHFWHLWNPQDVPPVPQQSSCFTNPGKAFPHWNTREKEVRKVRERERERERERNYVCIMHTLTGGGQKKELNGLKERCRNKKMVGQ